MVVIGIDPGTKVCGWAVIKDGHVLVNGNINMRSSDDEPLVRSVLVTNGLRYMIDKVLEEHEVDVIAIENQFLNRRTPSGIKIAHLVGMIVYMSYVYYNIVPVLIAPSMVYYNLPFKRSDFGTKNAFHKAVYQYVKETYNLKLDTIDEAFAVLIGKTAYDLYEANKVIGHTTELGGKEVCVLTA